MANKNRKRSSGFTKNKSRRDSLLSPNVRNFVLVVAALLVALAVVVGFLVWKTRKPVQKSLEQRIYERSTGWLAEADTSARSLADLLSRAEATLERGDEAELERLSKQADEIGRELSVRRIEIARWLVVENEALNQMKDQTSQVHSYLVEAAETVQALPRFPREFRKDFLNQGRRLVALATTSSAWIKFAWKVKHGTEIDKSSTDKPMIDDSPWENYRWSSAYAGGMDLGITPWKSSGMSAEEASSRAMGSIAEWATKENHVANDLLMTPTVSSACADMEMFQRVDKKVLDWDLIRKAFSTYAAFDRAMAAEEIPKEPEGLLIYAAAWRGTRGFQEAYVAGLAGEKITEMRSQLLFKAYRLAVLATTSWNQALDTANWFQSPFSYLSGCQGRLEILFLSPWDVARQITDIPGPHP
jgi:F0F1-type ATP synthase membrane subunit b/b'